MALTLVVILSVPGSVGTVAAQEVTVTQSTSETTAEPGETVTLETTISVTDANGPGLQIQLPDGWLGTFTDVDGGSAKPALGEQANLLEVVWLSPGTYAVTYEVDVPADATAGDYTVDVEGSAINPDTSERIVESTQTTITVEEPDQNTAPTADAGDDQTVDEGDEVTLDATGSSDQDGDSLSYSWTQTAGPDVTLSDADTATPSFTAPEVDDDETLTFQVEVADGNGGTDTDTVDVTVQDVPEPNQDPTAAFTVDPASPEVDEEVTLDASNSEDSDGEIVSYEWTVDGGALDTGETVTTSFDAAGDYDVALTVEDDDGATDTTSQVVTVVEAPPENKETTVSLEPSERTIAIGVTTTYEVVVDNAQGGVGAGELRIAVDDSSVAELTDAAAVNGGSAEEVEVAADGSFVDVDFAFSDTTDTGPVPVVEVTVVGSAAGSADLSIEPSDGNSEVLVFDEEGTGYDVTDTSGASVTVEAAQFLVEDGSLEAPEKAAVGSTVTVTADVTNDGSVQDTQSVEFRLDLDADGTLETVATEQVTIDGGETVEVSFEVTVPADASFGVRDHGVFTAADSSTAQIEFTPPKVNPNQELPGDPDGDGLYEDVNGDGAVDTGDSQSLFSNRDAPAVQNYIAQYDFNGDGSVNVGDAQALFSLVTGQ